MKIRRLFILILVVLTLSYSYGQKTRFFVSTKFVGAGDLRRFQGAAIYFISYFDNKLKEGYPCTTVITNNDIGDLLGYEKMRNLLGSETPGLMESIRDALGCEYLISLELGILPGEKFVINAALIPYRDNFPSLHASAYSDFSANSGDQNFKSCEEVAKKIIDKLKEYEICPYKGPIKIEVLSDLDVDVKNEYPVYCNEQDRTYKISYKENKHSKNTWNLEKTTRVYARTFVDYNISEETEKIVDDGCYPCPSGKTRRYFRQTITKTGHIDKVSEESRLFGERLNDARIEIRFADDGTYTMKVDAASAEADITTTINQQAESWCDENVPIKTIKHKTDIGLTYIFGPYKGLATDEVLAQNPDPIVIVNPISKEKTTYIVSFNLKKE